MPPELKDMVQKIVAEAVRLRDSRTPEREAPVNYACIFAQDEQEYETLLTAANKIGKIVQETAMGPVFYIEPLETAAGTLRLLKIRKPDEKRTERGDADFTVTDYQKFKKRYLNKTGFKLIERSDMEMIELTDSEFNVLAYFSNPSLGKVLKLDI